MTSDGFVTKGKCRAAILSANISVALHPAPAENPPRMSSVSACALPESPTDVPWAALFQVSLAVLLLSLGAAALAMGWYISLTQAQTISAL